MLALKQGVFDVALLRRTKAERASDIALPPKLIKLRRDLLDEKELDFYNAIYTQSVAQFDTYVQRGVLLNNCARRAATSGRRRSRSLSAAHRAAARAEPPHP